MMQIIMRVRVPQGAKGKTRHLINGNPMPTPVELQIAREDGEAGFYLLYIGHDGVEMNDSLHESIVAAQGQAHWEYGIENAAWQNRI